MFIIKNRVTGEYDTRGLYNSMNKFNKSSWNKLAQAKSHVAQKVTVYYNRLQYVDWYIDADYIEIDETGALNVFPVIDHLKTYFTDNYKAKYLTNDQKIKLGLN